MEALPHRLDDRECVNRAKRAANHRNGADSGNRDEPGDRQHCYVVGHVWANDRITENWRRSAD